MFRFDESSTDFKILDSFKFLNLEAWKRALKEELTFSIGSTEEMSGQVNGWGVDEPKRLFQIWWLFQWLFQ